MVASYNTVKEVLRVIRLNVDDETMRRILVDLKSIQGNTSFKATIERMIAIESGGHNESVGERHEETDDD